MKNTDIFIENKALKSVDFFSRIALFVVFFWFGFLKVLGTSPAENLVHKLFDITLAPFMSIEAFLPFFGAFECLIGIIWLFPKVTRIAFILTLGHMVCTFIPLVLLTSDTWQSSFTLTLTGQYIIKNVVLLTSAWYLYAINCSRESGKLKEEIAELAEVRS